MFEKLLILAETNYTQKGVNTGVSEVKKGNTHDVATIVSHTVNVVLFVIGILAVIMLIFGGVRFVTSNGDDKGVEGAKKTIMFAVIGLIIAIVAYALVNFITVNISK